MAIKRVLLPVGGDGSVEPLSDIAFSLGEKFSAQVMGLLVQTPSLEIPYFDVTGMEKSRVLIERVQQSSREAAAKAESDFKSKAERFPHVETVFRSVVGDVEASFAQHSRLADISVVTPPDPLENGFWGSRYWLDVQNATLFRSGRPVLFVPPRAISPSFETVVIAWKESLEAARAIAAAQPFMALAREVHLVTIKEGDNAVAPLQEVEDYLTLHYDEVRSEVISGESHQVGKLLLAQAYDRRALLIMGAYSHWRWRERLLGGATDYVLREASIPVLMVH
jgi:nucleotide-binding universal stress UspA family protein